MNLIQYKFDILGAPILLSPNRMSIQQHQWPTRNPMKMDHHWPDHQCKWWMLYPYSSAGSFLMQSIHVSHGSLLSNQTVISFKNPGDHFCCDFQLHPDYLCWMHLDFWKHNFFLLRGTCFLLSWRFHIFLSRTILCRGCFLCFCTFWNFLEFLANLILGCRISSFLPWNTSVFSGVCT